MFPTIADTISLIMDVHKGEREIPYYWHLMRVALRINNATDGEVHAALLHDILEDTHIREDDLKNLGYSNEVIKDVKFCSNIYYKELSFAKWMTHLKDSAPDSVIKVKVADLYDNISYERMREYVEYKKAEVSQPKPFKLDTLSDRVFKKVNKEMHLPKGAKIYERYIKGIEILSDRLLNENIRFGSFVKMDDIQGLSKFMVKEDLRRYAALNKLSSLEFSFSFEVVYDKNKQPYLSLMVPDELVGSYNNVLRDNIVDADSCIEKKQIRDSGVSHITVVSAAEFGKMKKIAPEKLERVLSLKQVDVFCSGIGSVGDGQNATYFSLVSSGYLDGVRDSLGLGKKDFHITLGFKEKDLHNYRKDRNSEIIKFNDVYTKMVESLYENSFKKRICP